jgi:hypothetical protein
MPQFESGKKTAWLSPRTGTFNARMVPSLAARLSGLGEITNVTQATADLAVTYPCLSRLMHL